MISIMWADFNYYVDSWAGNLIPAREFDNYAIKAQRLVNYITQGRAEENVTDKVKNAVCAGAEAAYEYRESVKNVPQGIKSESTDGHSVTYADLNYASKCEQEDKAIYNAVIRELSGTDLLYRGADYSAY